MPGARPGPGEPLRLLPALLAAALAAAVAFAGLQAHALMVEAAAMTGEVSAAEQPAPLLAELARGRAAALPLAALLAAAAALAGALVMAWARARAAAAAPALQWRRRVLLPAGTPGLVRRAARWPQVLLVAPLAALGLAATLLLPGADPGTPVEPQAARLLGGGLIALAFPLLVGERLLAAVRPTRLPEAPALRALALLATLAAVAAGGLELAAAAGLPVMAARLAVLAAALPGAVAAELLLRALGRGFVPPPAAEAARGVSSLLARLLAEGAAARSLVAPVRRHLGIDFAGSWALAYVRAAFAPLALLVLLAGWASSGVALVPLDARAVYERFGAPVRVLPPGLHLVLPWPFGRLRPVEFGAVHELALNGNPPPEAIDAEAVPPATADRLWEQENPAETWFLVAPAGDGRQGFQMVSADIRLFWRVGLDDADALRAAYGAVDPVGLLREEAARLAAAFFARRTLDEALGDNRETMAGRLRAAVQQALDEARVGLELDGVVIEALHPPGGAADAYHAVQAAQIDAEASIAAERGRAFATLSGQRQVATGLQRAAVAGAAEIVGAARAGATSFAADRDADRDGAPPFRLERRLAALRTVLGAAGLTLIDHRLPAAAAALLDLRPVPGAPVPPGAPARNATP